jgi:hypothetical protein
MQPVNLLVRMSGQHKKLLAVKGASVIATGDPGFSSLSGVQAKYH